MSNNGNNTKQAFWIALGSLFSFGFTIVSSMILSRYFPKEDYGTYKQVMYVYSTMLTVFTLGLPKAFSYFLPRVAENQAKSLIKKLTNLFFILGGIFSLILFFASDYIAGFLKNPDLTYALKLFSPVPLLILPTMGLEGILATFRMTKFMTVYTVATRTGMLLCVALPVMFFGGDYIHAVMGFVAASFVSFILALYFKYYPVRNKRNDLVEITYKEIFKFSLPLLTASIWGILISSADQFFISRYFGTEVFAEFSNGSLELPFVSMIVGATAAVLSPVFSKMSHEKLDPQNEIFPIWKSVFEKSAMLIYPLLIYTWVFADVIMIVLYGSQYENSAIYYRIKTIVNFFTLIVFTPLIINIGKVKHYSNVHMYGAIVLIMAEFITVKTIHSPYILVAVSVLCQLGRIYFMLRLVASFFQYNIYQLFPLKLISKIVLPSFFILLLEYYLLVVSWNFSPFLVLCISFPIYTVVLYFLSLKFGLDYLSIVKPLYKKGD